MPVQVDPQDYSEQYNTQLPPTLEMQFQRWLKMSGRQSDLYNYDIRGAWLAATQGNPETMWLLGTGNADTRGHLPDTWKKPNHPTFSTGSQYQSPGVTGGQWTPTGAGTWRYNASPTNMRMQEYPNALRDYFRSEEPNSRLMTPAWGPLK